jgi:outer membrane murein-binding lipoprotein Lpp
VINVATGVLEGVELLATAGREGLAVVDGAVGDVRAVAGEVESAVGEIAQDVSDKGLILTLLPPEKEQRLVAGVDRAVEVVETIAGAIESAIKLIEAIDRIPFINLPKPDPAKVAELESDVQALQDGAEQLASDIQDFRDGVATEIGAVSDGAGRVSAALGEVQDGLAGVDSDLEGVQQGTAGLLRSVQVWTAVFAIVVTLLLGWAGYGMVKLIMGEWPIVRGQA